mmetsp:Transcript_8930/g.16192  ORF Transcript_8930/g.16192 Transcript_8930/m.16192 type:complete len:107 (-) Transcript_8930:11-331(-)
MQESVQNCTRFYYNILTGLERPNGRLDNETLPLIHHLLARWTLDNDDAPHDFACKLQYSKAAFIQYSWQYSICLNTRLHPSTHMLGSSVVEPSSTRFSIDSSVESL